MGRFFRCVPDLAVFRRFPGLLASGWSSYHLCAESVLNRKFQENNLFRAEMRKIM